MIKKVVRNRNYKSDGSVITKRLYIDVKQDLKKEKNNVTCKSI